MTWRCSKCGQTVAVKDIFYECPVCLALVKGQAEGAVGAADSPSAPGSARTVAVEQERGEVANSGESEQPSLSSLGRSARVSGPEASAVHHLRQAATYIRCTAAGLVDGSFTSQARYWQEKAEYAEGLAAHIEAAFRLKDAPPAAGERAFARNDKLRHGGENQ